MITLAGTRCGKQSEAKYSTHNRLFYPAANFSVGSALAVAVAFLVVIPAGDLLSLSRHKLNSPRHHRSPLSGFNGTTGAVAGAARFLLFTGGAAFGGRCFALPFRRLLFVSITARIQ